MCYQVKFVHENEDADDPVGQQLQRVDEAQQADVKHKMLQDMRLNWRNHQKLKIVASSIWPFYCWTKLEFWLQLIWSSELVLLWYKCLDIGFVRMPVLVRLIDELWRSSCSFVVFFLEEFLARSHNQTRNSFYLENKMFCIGFVATFYSTIEIDIF